nr:PREDICTED: intracellular protein transport protein USO1-like isoform X2 [Bemisia tabaci]
MEKYLIKNLKMKDDPEKVVSKGKEDQYCHRMVGDLIGDSDNKSFNPPFPDTIVPKIKDLERIFNTLKKSVETNSATINSEETIPLEIDAKTVETISSLISYTILKISKKKLREDFERIQKEIDAIDSNWKLDASSKRENFQESRCEANIIKTVTDQIENIQNQVEQISQTSKLLNDEMLRQKENIINLDGRINEITSPKKIFDFEALKKEEWFLSGDQCHGNPDFWIAKLLRNIETLAHQLKNEKKFQVDRGIEVKESMEEDFKESINSIKQDTRHQKNMLSPMNNIVDTEFPPENIRYKQHRSNIHPPSNNLMCSSEIKKIAGQKSSAIRRMKRYDYYPKTDDSSRVGSTKQLNLRRSAKMETSSLRRPMKFLNTSNNKHRHEDKSERGDSPQTESFSPLLAHLFAADPDFITDLIGKEVEKRIPELIRINKIPKLLDEIAFQAIKKYHNASAEIPFTVTRGKLTHQTPRVNIRYLEIKKKSSLTRKNIFNYSHEVNENKLQDNQFRKRASSDDLRMGRGASKGDSQKRTFENQPFRKSENSSSKGIDQTRAQDKLSYPNLHWKKENLELYSEEFLAAIKRSFVEIISHEIKKSITELVRKETSPGNEKDPVGLKDTSATSLKPLWGSTSRELIKNEPASALSIVTTGKLQSSYNIASKTDLTSQITLDCVQQFVDAVKTMKIQKNPLLDNEKISIDMKEESRQKLKPADRPAENSRQGSNIQPNLFVPLPGIHILDSFLSGQVLGSSSLPTEEKKISAEGESNCCECITGQNCPQTLSMKKTDSKNCSDTSTCKCSSEFSNSSCD